mmetsp:Transcript_85565/g.266056  ORF Transcript_85565/g.266056 Transcript_85565/m.266056 type:complete len:321 (+) Transcript_85565:71-1033(+)
MTPQGRAVASALFAALCCLCPLGSALRVVNAGGRALVLRATPAAESEAPRRIALVLRGETFRGGLSNHHFVVKPQWTYIQQENWQNQMDTIVHPFEKDGYEVDVITAAYPTSYDSLLYEVFGDRVKVFEKLDWEHPPANQGLNAVQVIETFMDYQKRTGKKYRFLIFARHDLRFKFNMRDLILDRTSPDDKVLLYTKHPITGRHYGSDDRCTSTKHFNWNNPDRTKISWWANDRLQVVAGKHIHALWQLMNGTMLNHPSAKSSPRWPNECWAEISPLVGGDQNIDFMDENTMIVCKAFAAHGTPRTSMERDTAGCDTGVR